MIQRIQTLYILLATTALGMQFEWPYSVVPMSPAAAAVPTFADGAFSLTDRPGLMIVTGIAIILALTAFFSFKRRLVQLRFNTLALFTATILAIYMATQFFFLANEAKEVMNDMQYRAGVGMPALSVLLLWLSGRAIRSDQQLVHSIDRLR